MYSVFAKPRNNICWPLKNNRYSTHTKKAKALPISNWQLAILSNRETSAWKNAKKAGLFTTSAKLPKNQCHPFGKAVSLQCRYADGLRRVGGKSKKGRRHRDVSQRGKTYKRAHTPRERGTPAPHGKEPFDGERHSRSCLPHRNWTGSLPGAQTCACVDGAADRTEADRPIAEVPYGTLGIGAQCGAGAPRSRAAVADAGQPGAPHSEREASDRHGGVHSCPMQRSHFSEFGTFLDPQNRIVNNR